MLTEGRIIGDRYEIIGRVGSGGMADVYKATDQRLNRFVAIKVLKSEYSSDKTFVSKFKGEAQAAAGLSHPNVVNVYDVGEEDDLHYIVMELVEGITLKKFIERKGKLEIKEAIGIAIQIAQGMEAAHDNHIIHRDIKPQNVIISREGKVKVTDFGIAKAASSNTITAGAVGSVHYISPEQARGGYSDEKSDIYSLGVTMYEMLSGRMPFAAENTVSVALLHIQEEATPLRELDPSIPVSVERIVQKCMQKKPERRYLTASELIRDLKRSLTDPSGDFVKLPVSINDSPTINITDEELTRIKNAKYSSSDTTADQDMGAAAILGNDDDDDMDPKVEKYLMVGGIVAIVALAAVIIVLVVNGFKLFKGNSDQVINENEKKTEQQAEPKKKEEKEPEKKPDTKKEDESKVTEATVPDLSDKTLEEAIKLLEDAGFKSYRYEYKYSEDVDKDKVISQTPLASTKALISKEIIIVVSDGETVLTIPDVYNRVQSEAETILEDEGFEVKHDFDYSDELEAGRVIETRPERGMEARKGDDVTVVISRGKETVMVVVPDLSDYDEDEAIQILKDAGLEAKSSYSHSNEYDEDMVMHQDIAPGTTVEEGTVVGISISLGVSYSYIGETTVSSPFKGGKTSGYLTIMMAQDGDEKVISSGNFNESDFPMYFGNLTGSSLIDGYVYVYVDDELCSTTWPVKFHQVEN